MPKPLRVPARLMLSALIGRVRIPDPIMARQSKSDAAPTSLPTYRWNPRYPARSASCRARRDADVRWFDVEPATSSTR